MSVLWAFYKDLPLSLLVLNNGTHPCGGRNPLILRIMYTFSSTLSAVLGKKRMRMDPAILTISFPV